MTGAATQSTASSAISGHLLAQVRRPKHVPARSSKEVVLVGLASDLAIAVSKFIAAAITHSSAMFAEALHSTADTGNELLLLIGMRRSTRPRDALHPFGHGKALYFYSLLVAVCIFGIGGGLSFYRGISQLFHAQVPTHLGWNFTVLGIAAAFDFYSWRVSYRELLARKDPGETTWDEIIGSKDPTVFTVFLEDSAGLAGILIAFLGIFLAQRLHMPVLDPIASILIGLLLAAVAVLLVRETGALLTGERTKRDRIRVIRDTLAGDPHVEAIGEILTMQLGPDQALLTVGIRFRRGLTIEQIEGAIEGMTNALHNKDSAITQVFIQSVSLTPSDHSDSRAA